MVTTSDCFSLFVYFDRLFWCRVNGVVRQKGLGAITEARSCSARQSLASKDKGVSLGLMTSRAAVNVVSGTTELPAAPRVPITISTICHIHTDTHVHWRCRRWNRQYRQYISLVYTVFDASMVNHWSVTRCRYTHVSCCSWNAYRLIDRQLPCSLTILAIETTNYGCSRLLLNCFVTSGHFGSKTFRQQDTSAALPKCPDTIPLLPKCPAAEVSCCRSVRNRWGGYVLSGVCYWPKFRDRLVVAFVGCIVYHVVCLSVSLSMPHGPWFKGHLQQTSHTQLGPRPERFSSSWSQRSRSRTEISASPDLWSIVSVCLSVSEMETGRVDRCRLPVGSGYRPGRVEIIWPVNDRPVRIM